MILDIPSLIVDCLPDTSPPVRDMSAVCVCCTAPTFLVFRRGQDHPAYVVKTGPHPQLSDTYQSLLVLFRELPEAIPEPMHLHPVSDDLAVMIQRGLAGAPWFTFGSTHRTRDAWLRLRKLAVSTLERFHQAVRRHSPWNVELRLGDSTRELLREIQQQGQELPPQTGDLIQTATGSLDALGRVPGFWQHGDFTLQNLLIDDGNVGIVDFDDFGGCSSPYLDNFGLALSIHRAASASCQWDSLSDDLLACAGGSSVFETHSQEQLIALYLHFLLWSITRTLGNPRRDAIRAQYLERLHDLAVNTSNFFVHPSHRQSALRSTF